MPTIRTNDITTHYEVRGGGPPVVFVHGAILDHTQWAPQLDALSDEFTTYAYDVRGHGRTGRSDVDSYSIELLADDLAAFVDALALEDPVICGLSTGGCIAQVYATRHPDRIGGLVLAGTFGPPYLSFGDRLQRQFVLPATIPPVRLVGYRRVERALVWLNETFGSAGSSGDYEQVQALRDAGPTMSSAEFTKTIRALRDFHSVDVDYMAITVPTLVLHGEHEPGFIQRHAQHFETLLPNVTVREVPKAGHASNMDNPEFYTDVLREFLHDCRDDDDSDDRDSTVTADPADETDSATEPESATESSAADA